MRLAKNVDDAAKEIEKAIKENDGYCCCQIKSEDSKCMCADFKAKIEDPNFEGECHCGLFHKYLK